MTITNNRSRRQFMHQLLGLSSGVTLLNSPWGLFLQSLLTTSLPIRSAQAQSNSGSGIDTHIQFSQYAAPPRWTYDLFLDPYSKQIKALDLKNSMLFTKYALKSGRYVENSVYDTILLESINCPPLWNMQVGQHAIKNLLKQMLVIQGIDIANASHTGAYDLHYSKPLGGAKSLGAILADTSLRPLAALNLGRTISFNSHAGRVLNTCSAEGNMISNALRSFLAPSGTTKKLLSDNNLKAAFDDLNAHIYKLSKDSHPSVAESLTQSQRGALDLFNTAFGDLEQKWKTLFTKYKALIDQAIVTIIPGVTDQPIGIEGSSKRKNGLYSMIDDSTYLFNKDLRDIFNPKHDTNPTNADTMAAFFAVLEFITVQKMSSFIHVNVPGFVNLHADLKGDGSANAISFIPQNFDEHYVGAIPSLLINSRYHLAFSACLLEFINILKSKQMWSKTLIEVSGEFNRSARKLGGGSDHGSAGKSVAIYSGRFAEQAPVIIGNLVASTDGDRNWGIGAASIEGRAINGADMAATISYLLGDQSFVTTGAKTLVTLNNGTINLPKIKLSTRINS